MPLIKNIYLILFLITLWGLVPQKICGQADIDPKPLVRECRIQLVDQSDKTPVSGAHICVETENGHKYYEVSDTQGKALLRLNAGEGGVIVISSIGYETTYVQCQTITDGALIPVNTDVFNIDQVVVTGTNKPTPVDSSIYKVKLITGEKIWQSGSVNLGELLLTEANIRIENDLVLGTRIEMLGMSGRNVKVMIDGVPVIGRLGGNIDLSQINLANVKQVEVIEGPMSVVYGNNALAGTINIITQKDLYHSTSVTANAYTESAGRYSGNAAFSRNVGKHSFSIDGGAEYFSGEDFEITSREMNWKPKNMHRINGGYQYNHNGWNINGKVGYFKDKLLFKGNKRQEGNEYIATDKDYCTDRHDLSLNASKAWGLNHIDMLAAYNTFIRSSKTYTKSFTTLDNTLIDEETSHNMNQKMFRGIYSRQIGLVALQAGVDLNVEFMKGERIPSSGEQIGDYAVFVNANFNMLESLEVQPGLRYAYNTDYSAPLVYSFNVKWNISNQWNWRASFARGFRAPDLKELFMEFRDSNHDIFGNPDLEAESSYNYNTSIEFSAKQTIHAWKLNAMAYYNTVTNMIDLVRMENEKGDQYTNINEYESTGGSIDLNYGYKSLFTIRAGYGLTARYNEYTKLNGSDKFNLSHDVFAGLKITEPKTRIVLNIDYKYSGKRPYYKSALNAESGDYYTVEEIQDAYQTMNGSLTYRFLKDRFTITAGAKNLLDVTSVNRQTASGDAVSSGAHNSGNGSTPIGYGRSYFINLIYKFNKYK
ncbi:MAG: TonB-dependent receptor [Marinilabiliaceae bacterium]|nr:TonB-dependent receptor [Marinilabiliaceae bacterium]